ncbi:hypothetical protein EDC01DRAFT_680667 [Geopyxis carbonaria]|nr:hypothetical protein EDC01DRAFT_680667 [Geopyxis carbonaria]
MIPHPLTRRRTGNAVDIYGARGSFVNNSVTLREREVFSQIFHDILAPRAAGAPPAVSATATGPAATTLPPALASLLGATSASSLSFAPPAAATLQLPPRTPRADATDAAANRVDLARLTQLRDALHATDTDAASLAWLDAHLFPLLAARDPSNLFAELFNSALALFHKRYHDPATVVALFERVKRAGVDAYVLGCDARTYNRVMRATWQAYGDVERVRALAEEMRANGVEPNFFTPKELARVVDEVRAVLEGRMGELARMCVSEVEAETVEWLDEEARRMKSVMRRENKNVLVAAAMKEAAMAQGRGEREERAREWGWPQEAERPYQR